MSDGVSDVGVNDERSDGVSSERMGCVIDEGCDGG